MKKIEDQIRERLWKKHRPHPQDLYIDPQFKSEIQHNQKVVKKALKKYRIALDVALDNLLYLAGHSVTPEDYGDFCSAVNSYNRKPRPE